MTDKTILLIDDDPDLLQAVASRCRSIGLQVQHARNLLTASEIIKKNMPDVISIDVNMPTGNGLRFCEMLAADPETANVPIIVLTGQQDAVTRKTCQRHNFHYVGKKSDVWAMLEPLIRQLVSQSAATAKKASNRMPTNRPTGNSIPPWPSSTGEPAAPRDLKSTKQIVVADDDADMVRLLSQRCSSLGCSVIGVNSALEAINVIHRVLPDMVFLDVNMPSGNGLSVCEMMSADDRLRKIPVVVLTGLSDEKTIRRCHDMLVFYVQKGANIWARVEPLVRELLHLGEATHTADHADPAPPPPATHVEAPVDKPVSTPADAPVDARDGLLDVVFAMLGSDADPSKPAADAGSQSSSDAATEDVPWVLCIDDDSDFSDALRTRFEQHGVAVARAFSGMDGYRLAFSSPASAIILDYNMPNGRGDYILDRLKHNPVTKNIPVFVLTGVKDRVLERRMLAMGAAGFLNKPVDFALLRTHLARYIDILDAPAKPLAVSSR